MIVCEGPGSPAKPSLVQTSVDSILISWTEPAENGGCPVSSYSVHIDDGESGEFSEANVSNDVQSRNFPTMRSFLISRIAYDIGKTYRIRVKAYNDAGSSESPILGVTFSYLPEQPPAPVKVARLSNSGQLTVDMSDFPETSKGGCDILTYNLQMDDGLGSEFISLVGETQPNLKLAYTAADLQKGLTYRFRYRVRNCRGWSVFSPELFALASQVPVKPHSAPILVSTSSTKVVLRLTPTSDNMGALVTDYTLFRN
jgi:hypothetical protein